MDGARGGAEWFGFKVSGVLVEGEESLGYGFDDLLVDFVDGEVAFNEDDAGGFAGGDFAVFEVDAEVELVLFLLEAAFVVAGFLKGALVAGAGAGEGGVKGGQEQEGQVGLEVGAEESMEIEDDLGAELTTAALVSLCGVSKSVAEEDFSGGEGGQDDLVDGLGAVSKHEGHLSQGGERGGAGIEEELADAVSGGGSAGLAGEDRGEAAAFEPGGQTFDLGGFT